MSSSVPEDRERGTRPESAPEPSSVSGLRRVYEPGSQAERQKTVKYVERGSLAEAFAGAAGVVLAIIGIAGGMPGYLAAIATIVIGIAFLAQGAAIAARWSNVLSETPPESSRTEIGTGVGAELLGGGAGVILGILALVGVAPATLLPIALLAFGGTLLLSTGTEVDLSSLANTRAEGQLARVMREAILAASGTQLLVAVAAVALGIVALVGANPIIMTLVGLLIVGGSILLSGTAIGSRMLAVRHH